ncbi:unnamed protein product [Prunus armeniaca]
MLLQGIVDHEMRFLDIVTGWPGGMTVSRLLKCSGFFKLCEGGQRLNENVITLSGGVEIREYLVGGVGYPLLPWLITPYESNGLPDSISAFNAVHGAARSLAVKAFTQLKGTWRILNKVMWRPDKRKLPSIILICLKADERDVYELFSRAGKVCDVRLIMDCNSRRSKGVGYIEFYDAMSVPMAIALSGQPLLGQPVMVKPSEAEKNLVESTSVVSGPGGMIAPDSGGARRLYVGNLHTKIKEDDLRQVFGAFGPVELVQLPVEETNNCKGFRFVQVSAVTDQAGMQDLGANAGDFDDDEGGGLFEHIPSRY